uniref:HAT C-terminal dimerisation domain-containing protein n=1 Tax=Astyanax mexicanus TaxID=7994 RepID=A0A3B1IVY8_ASTMX
MCSFVFKDITAIDTVSGQGFSKLAQHLVDTAAKIGKFDVKEMLSLVDIMTETISKIRVKTSFLSATIHYIDDSYNLVSRVLFASPFEPGTSKTGDNIRSLLFQNLRVFGIDCTCTNMVNKIVFVTDRGANMVSSLRDFTRINCSAHILNVILSSAFATAVMENACEVSQLITDVKKLVTYFKHSGQQGKLTKSLKQAVETRWNSVFDMTDSVLQQFEEISTILLENNQYGKIGCINKNMLTTVVSFLKPFKDATNDLESDSSTLSGSLVLPWVLAIPALTEVASVCVRRLNELMSTDNSAPNAVHRLYRVATFLTPKLRHLKMLDNYARADVMNAVKELIANLMFESKNDEPQPPAKRAHFREFEEWEDKGSMAKDGTTTAESEINDYLSVKLDTTEESGSHQVLQWWKNHRLEFPSLSKLARHVLCIPASSAPSNEPSVFVGEFWKRDALSLKPEVSTALLL